jgi:hypothetical protein
MEIVIVLIIVTMILVMFWSIKVSKRFSVTLFGTIFLGIAVAIISWQGFTQQAFENIGFIAIGFLVMWLRLSKSIADTARARNWLEDRLRQSKYSNCEVCGKKLSYHRTPKNASQLLLGGLTCENCGAEFDVPFDVFMPW